MISVDSKEQDMNKEYQYRKEETNWSRLLFLAIISICSSLMFYICIIVYTNWGMLTSMLMAAPLLYALLKLFLSLFYRPYQDEVGDSKNVSVIIPSYLESPESITDCVHSILAQEYTVHEIIFIDDGSPTEDGYRAAQEIANYVNNNTRIKSVMTVHRFEKNQGKREAQKWGFKHATGEFVMIIDSDSYFFKTTIKEIMKPFARDNIWGVTGHVRARNKNKNIMTLYQDALYDRAFYVGRGVQSLSGDVLVCSGALSVFRRDFIMANLDDFTRTTFGKKNSIGDDRRLTNMAHEGGGRIVYQATAQCLTDVPDNPKKFLKQQTRWSKSFFVESIRAYRFAWKRPMFLFWLTCELILWLFFLVSLLFHLDTLHEYFSWSFVFYQSIYIMMIGFVCNAYYARQNILSFLLSPIYIIIHAIWLIPVRIYALCTLNNAKWGTR
ncbi:glycosyltransferase [Listeria grandensis]|uniref:glycosyltransferase n=1 Tax=Listeria grandensis TaxID=1494963 RepID=UPI00164CE248|nr:glycosyltransferase family 2 protein [Listeria grandensis]MBC6315573.1 glycosyltransferase family 2 protein [Listeria grandensis]